APRRRWQESTSKLRSGQWYGFSTLAPPLWLVGRSRARACRRGRAVVDAVEQQLERAVRLRAPVHLVAEQHDVTFADRRLDDRDRLIEVLLAPRPPAAQR